MLEISKQPRVSSTPLATGRTSLAAQLRASWQYSKEPRRENCASNAHILAAHAARARELLASQTSELLLTLAVRNSVALFALLCTGCPLGTALDTPYEQYVPPAGGNGTSGTSTGVGGATMTSTATATTTGGVTCGDAEVDVVFYEYCSTSACHGEPGMANSGLSSGLDLFAPDRVAQMANRPGVVTATHDCSAELVIDTANPAASLLVTSVKRMAPCGLNMPPFAEVLALPASEVACIEQWVNSVASGGP